MLEDKTARQELQTRVAVNPSNAVGYIHIVARRVIVWSAIIATACASGIGTYPVAYAYLKNEPWISQVIQKHFAATVGLPTMAALAFLIVITFEARFDAIEMEFFGIVKFKGASGPIVLWTLCFLTMACCLRMLW